MKATASTALVGLIATVMLHPLSAAAVPAAVPSALSIFTRCSNIYKSATSIQQLWVTKSSMGEMGYMKIFSHSTSVGNEARLAMTMVMDMKVPASLGGPQASPPVTTTKLILYAAHGTVTYYNSANNKYLQQPVGVTKVSQLIGRQNIYSPILKRLGLSITDRNSFEVKAGTFNGKPVWWITVKSKAISAHETAHSKQAVSPMRTKRDSPDGAASSADNPPSSLPMGVAVLKNAHTTMAFSQQTGEFLGMRIVQKYPGQPAPVVVTVTLLGSKLNARIPPSTMIWVAPKGAKKEPDMAGAFVGTFH